MNSQDEGKKKSVTSLFHSLTPLGTHKKKIKMALVQSEQKYKTAFEYTGTGMLVLEEDMTISLVNQKILDLTGFSREEIEGKRKWTEVVVCEDKQRMTEYHFLRRCDPDKIPTEYEFRYLHKDGSAHDALASVSMIPGTKQSLVSLIDISDRKQTEAALRLSEKKYRDLFENANDIIYTHDLEGRFVNVNRAGLETYGYTHDEIIQIYIQDIVDPDYMAIAQERMREKIKSNSTSAPYQILTHKKSGEAVWIEICSRLIRQENRIIGIQGIARNITDRKEMEERLQESQRRFKETAELLPGIICEFDSRMCFTYVNKLGLERFGYTQDDFDRGITILDVIHPEDKQRALENISLRLSGVSIVAQEYRMIHKDNTVHDYLITSSPIIKDNQTIGMRSCLLDISKRKAMEMQIRESEELLRKIITASPIGVAVFNKAGCIIDINDSFRQMFGFPHNLCDVEQTFSLFDTIEEMKSFKDKKINGTSLSFESRTDFKFVKQADAYEIVPMKKRIFSWYVTAFGMDSRGEKLLLGQVQDITERKRMEETKLKQAQQDATEARQMLQELQNELNRQAHFHTMISRCSSMQDIFNILPEIALSPTTVLITGESGTGKELIARSIHSLSSRKDKPFIAINCGALPDSLLESELFGYKAGAFTDAKKDKPGKFFLAQGGTLFLDEIGDVSPAMQVKLLRVLQERIIEPLGATRGVPIDVRVIAATNKDLPALVNKGDFREDLYYRIKVFSLSLPPLRERKSDIPLLCEHFIADLRYRFKKDIHEISSEAIDMLLAYNYPGNIRELKNILEHAFIFCKSTTIDQQHLPREILNTMNTTIKPDSIFDNVNSFEELEKMFIVHILTKTNGNRIKAAQRLGIHKSTLFRKLKHHGIEMST